MDVGDSMRAKLTDWFAPSVLPARVGVYETTSEGGSFQFWDGRVWRYCAGDAETAARSGYDLGESSYQDGYWRGLASDPSKESDA